MADTFLFPKDRKIKRQAVLADGTLRDFSGGWNVVDNDLNLSTKFSKVFKNVHRSRDGAVEIRPGTKLFAETSAILDEIVNITYFNSNLVAVGKNGKVVRIDGTGAVSEIFSDDWAEDLPGAPSGWSDKTTFVSFAEFNGELIICNGINKPLLVSSGMIATYLQDLADLHNTFTLICKYVTAHNRYVVMSGDPNNVDRIYISNTDTSGTWVGNSAPNDAVSIDLGSRIPSGSQAVTGIGAFRDKIAVFFENVVLPGTLGTFDGSDHTPVFDDAIENVGALSHRTIETIGEDMMFTDLNGVASISRALFTGAVRPEKLSHFIDPEIQSQLSKLNTTAALEERTFAVYDSVAAHYMLFLPDSPSEEIITEYRGFVLKKVKPLKIEAWQEFGNWKFRCGCRSALKNIFLCVGTQVYQLGRVNEKPATKTFTFNRDFIGDQEMFDDDTVFTDNTGFNPVADINDSGVSIPFDWELPWSDAGRRFNTKNSRYINFDTEGNQRFTCQMFIDNIFEDRSFLGEAFLDGFVFDDDLGWDVRQLDPTLEMEFIGGDAPGFGSDGFGNDFGGSRPTRLENLYAWSSKYKLQKLRMTGDGLGPLKFISISLAHQTGSIRR